MERTQPEGAGESMMFLYMLPLALLPVLFHLFMRVRKQVRPFPSLMFFLQADPRMSARKKIKEWLALMLRVMAIACLLLALSRPMWHGAGGGGPVAQVLVIDNSGSMSGASKDGVTKLADALDAAAAMVTEMGDADSAAIVLLVDDPEAAIPAGFVSDKEVLRAALSRIRDTQASGSPALAVDRAIALLSRSSTAQREIHVFSDLQEGEWGVASQEHRMLPSNTQLEVHAIASKPFESANVSIAGVELPHKRLIAGRRYLAGAGLNNTSASDARVRLDSTDQTGAQSFREVEVPARSTRIISVPFESQQSGVGWLSVDVENDSFMPDNHACASFVCQERKKVVFIGRPDDFGNLPLAVSPSGDGVLSGLVPVFHAAGGITQEELGNDCAMAVCTWSALPKDRRGEDVLRAYVGSGGKLLVVPGNPDGHVVGRLPDWLGASPGQQIGSASGIPLVGLSGQSHVWDDLRDEGGEISLREVKAFRLAPLSVSSNAAVIMALADGTAVITQNRVGKGAVYGSGIGFDVKDSNMPLKGGFVALVHCMALSALGDTSEGGSVTAGMRTPGLDDSETDVKIHALTGAVLDWSGEAVDVPAFARSGVYSVDTGKKKFVVAVMSAPGEGREEYVKGTVLPALSDLPHRIEEYKERASFVRQVMVMRAGIDLYLPFLLAALLAVFAEGLIVNSGAVHAADKAPGRKLLEKLAWIKRAAGGDGGMS